MIIGNITGSNIFNLSLLIGIGACFTPLKFITNFNNLIFILIAALFIFEIILNLNKKDEITANKGILLIFLYFGYLLYMY